MRNQELTTSEKLNLLLDGETEGVNASEVFYSLSQDSDLQQEFIDMVRLKKVMKDLPETPPDHLKRGVFAGLGLTGGGVMYYLQSGGFATAAYSFITSKVGIALSSLIIGSLLTFSVMENNNGSESLTDNSEKASQITLSELEPAKMSIPIVSSEEKVSVVSENKNSNENIANTSDNVNSTENENSYLTQISNSAPVISYNRSFASLNNSGNDIFSNRVQTLDQDNYSLKIDPKSGLDKTKNYNQPMLFSLQVRGLRGNSITNYDSSPTESPAVNDIGIALMYSVNDNFAVGMEFGQEFLVQKVRGNSIEMNGTVNENLLTFWGGLKGTYTANELEIVENLKPNASLLLGGTNNGWIGKGSLGLVYDLSGKLAFFGGPEWTTMIYKHDSAILSSHKWGMHYGISIKF